MGRGPLEQDPHLAGPVMTDDEQAADAGASAGKDATACTEALLWGAIQMLQSSHRSGCVEPSPRFPVDVWGQRSSGLRIIAPWIQVCSADGPGCLNTAAWMPGISQQPPPSGFGGLWGVLHFEGHGEGSELRRSSASCGMCY